MDHEALLALSVDVTALLHRPLPRGALGSAGLLGAIAAADALVAADPVELARRDALTASVVREHLGRHRP